MATTENLHIGDGSKTKFSFTFPYLQEADVKVYLFVTDAWVLKTLTTHYTFANATTIQFGSAPAAADSDEQTALGDTNNIKIKRLTDSDSLSGTFYPGSAIRSSDLNDNFTQNLYVTQEANNNVTTATTDAAAAVVTANTASTTATTANTTANTANTNATAAVSTANTASTNATTAVSTANTASTNAANAVTTANSAEAAVSSVLPYTIVANKAALLSASVTQDDIYEVTDTTDLEDLGGGSDVIWVNSAGSTSGQDIAALKPNVTWDSGITLKMKKYGISNSDRKWIFQSYFANDPETKYAATASPTFTGTPAAPTAGSSTNTTQIATTAFAQPRDADLTSLSSCQTGGAAALALLTSTEIGIIDGATLSTAELNYVDGVTSAIQTQLDAKGVGDAVLASDQTWTGAQRGTISALTSAASITIDFDAANHYSVTLGHNAAFANPTTEDAGQSGSIFITQDGSGSRTASWGTQWLFAGGTAPTLTTTAAAVDRIDYIVAAADKIHAVATLDIKATS